MASAFWKGQQGTYPCGNRQYGRWRRYASYRALKEGTDLLKAQRARQLGYGEYYIVVVTDGEPSDGDDMKGAEYAVNNNVSVVTIGFCLGEKHALNKYSVSSHNVADPSELFRALRDTQAELKEYDFK